MAIDFEELRKSHLFTLGTLCYNKQTETLFQSDFSSFDVYSSSEKIFHEPARKWKSSSINVNPHLYRLLDNSNISGINDLLISQWKEINDIINKLPVIPHAGLLVMEPAGVPVRIHVHSGVTKQILSFSYSFPETKIINSEASHLIIGHDEYKVPFPDSEKSVSMFIDNERHGAITNEWRFFWAYDFPEKFTVPDELIKEFTKFYWDTKLT